MAAEYAELVRYVLSVDYSVTSGSRDCVVCRNMVLFERLLVLFSQCAELRKGCGNTEDPNGALCEEFQCVIA